MSDSLRPYGLKHARLPCPSLSPRVCSDSCPLSHWCYLTSAVPFSFCLQSFPGSGSFPVSRLFASDGQSIEASAFGISPSNEYLGLISFRIDWFDLAVQWTLKSLLQHHNSKASILWCLAFFMVHLSHWYMTTATAKSLQLCPTLCDPIDGSPPGSPIPGILQARILERVAISFSNAWKWKVKVKLLSRVWLLATPWTAAFQAPLSMGFSRQEYWSGLPLPSPRLQYHKFE